MLTLPVTGLLTPKPPYLPLAIPADLANRLIRVHGDPAVWFTAQFTKYLMRPQPQLQAQLDAYVKKIRLPRPCVGYVGGEGASQLLL